jgi:hypothetical protein
MNKDRTSELSDERACLIFRRSFRTHISVRRPDILTSSGFLSTSMQMLEQYRKLSRGYSCFLPVTFPDHCSLITPYFDDIYSELLKVSSDKQQLERRTVEF